MRKFVENSTVSPTFTSVHRGTRRTPAGLKRLNPFYDLTLHRKSRIVSRNYAFLHDEILKVTPDTHSL